MSSDPVAPWRALERYVSLLAALFLVLAHVVPTSAPNKQLSSQYADIHPKRRNQLGYEKMAAIQRLRANILSEHLPLSTRPSHKRRISVSSPTGDVALSTSSTMELSRLNNGDGAVLDDNVVHDIPDISDSYEFEMREWLLTLDDENRSLERPDDPEEEEESSRQHPLSGISNLRSGLDPIIATDGYDATWSIGQGILATETAYFVAMANESSASDEDDETICVESDGGSTFKRCRT